MTSTWVWRHDGTLQCGFGVEQTLDEAREELATIIGDDNILNGEKRTLPGPIIQLCGAPTGQVIAFELTEFGWWLLFIGGIAGPIGFRPWADLDGGRLLSGSGGNFTTRLLAGSEGNYTVKAPDGKSILFPGHDGTPTTIEELYGRICRVYNVGDALTKDFIERRVNIGLVRGRVAEVWFG